MWFLLRPLFLACRQLPSCSVLTWHFPLPSPGCLPLLIRTVVMLDQGPLWALCYTVLSHSIMSDSVTPGIVAHQAPLFMEFSRQEYWSGLPCLPPGDLPNPGIKPRSPTLQADSLPSEPPGKPKDTGVGSLSLLQGILTNPVMEPGSPVLQADSLPAELYDLISP